MCILLIYIFNFITMHGAKKNEIGCVYSVCWLHFRLVPPPRPHPRPALCSIFPHPLYFTTSLLQLVKHTESVQKMTDL